MDTEFTKQLLDAAYNGNLTIVEMVLKLMVDINSKGEYGDTALNKAADQGHLELIKYLIEKGADVNNKGGADLTPIMNAATAGHTEVVQLLIDKGAILSNDLLSTIQMKVNILKENSELGMVTKEGYEAWRKFFEYLIEERKKQDENKK